MPDKYSQAESRQAQLAAPEAEPSQLSQGGVSDFAAMFGPIGQMLFSVFGRMAAGTTNVKTPQGDVALPAWVAGDVYRAGTAAQNALNNQAFAGVRRKIYGLATAYQEKAATKYLVNVLHITDPERVKQMVSSTMAAQRWIANQPILQQIPDLRRFPFMKDTAAEITRNVAMAANAIGMSAFESSPEMIDRFGIVATHALEAMYTTEQGQRRPSDIAKFLGNELAEKYRNIIYDNRAFTKDDKGQLHLVDKARSYIDSSFRRSFAGTEMLAGILGQQGRSLLRVKADFENNLLGRNMVDKDFDQIQKLFVAKAEAGVGNIGMHIMNGMRRLNAAGIKPDAILTYLPNALAQYAAMKKSPTGFSANMLEGKVIDHLMGLQIAGPVSGYNPVVIAAALKLKAMGNQKGINELGNFLGKMPNPRDLFGYLRSKNLLVNSPNVALRLAHTPDGESVYQSLLQSNAGAWFQSGVVNAIRDEVGAAMHHFQGSGKLVNKIMPSEVIPRMAQKYGIEDGDVVTHLLGNLGNTMRNMASYSAGVWNRAADNMKMLYPSSEPAETPLQGVKGWIGGSPGVGYVPSPSEQSNKLTKGAPIAGQAPLSGPAPATATPGVGETVSGSNVLKINPPTKPATSADDAGTRIGQPVR